MPRKAAMRPRPAAGFGALLKELRRNRSVEEVLQALRGRSPYIDTNQAVVSAYEQGYHANPDPVVLWGLALMYGVSVDGLIAVLFANRRNSHLTVDDARAVLMEHSRGPRPEMAAAALETAETRLFNAAADLQSLRESLREGATDHAKRSRG